jgi:putative DNA primase/helicase
MTLDGLEELAREQARLREKLAENGASERTRLRAVSVDELLKLEIPTRQYLLEPIFREKETAMIHAWRGVGKTYFALEIAFAVASGGSFLRWRAPCARPVLYVDGEMPARTMQERLAAITNASTRADDFDPANLQLVCADLQDAPLPNLATPEGQTLLAPFVDAADFIVVDSISTLATGYGRENEAESWLPMHAWALQLRRRGKSVLFLHHEGKGGQQRGTSRKEDILDLVIGLQRPSDYDPREGARFEAHFKKTRGLSGDAVFPFEATLEVREGKTVWAMRTIEAAQLARAAALYNDGAKPADVAQELSVSRATAYRLKAKAREEGLLS